MKILIFLGISREIQSLDFKCNVDHTITGRKCQNWASQTPHPHEFDPGNGLNFFIFEKILER